MADPQPFDNDPRWKALLARQQAERDALVKTVGAERTRLERQYGGKLPPSVKEKLEQPFFDAHSRHAVEKQQWLTWYDKQQPALAAVPFARRVPCPYPPCAARPGERCTTRYGKPAAHEHSDRVDRARGQAMRRAANTGAAVSFR